MKNKFGRMLVFCFFIFGFFPNFANAAESDFELVESVPMETTLGSSKVRDTYTVWKELIEGAKQTIDIAQFYIVSEANTDFQKILDLIVAKAQAGVKIRILSEASFLKNYSADIDRFKKQKNISYRAYDISKLTGGILHAKYFIVDGKKAFLGSQNFDWRSLDHNSELGLAISDVYTVRLLESIFEYDWNIGAIESSSRMKTLPKPRSEKRFDSTLVNLSSPQLFASPKNLLPEDFPLSEMAIVNLIASAQKSIKIHLLSYSTSSKENAVDTQSKTYLTIDNALIAAAKRGVAISMLLSDWSQAEPKISAVKKLATQKNISIKLVTIPEAKTGFIPFARTIHSKFMVVDNEKLLLGTSNWSFEYFHESRNIELVIPYLSLAHAADAIFQKTWNSSYAFAVDPLKEYPKPRIAK